MCDDIDQLLDGLRRGDSAAIRQLVSQYEPYLRRSLRMRLAKANLRAAADSADLCQSVMNGFLIRMIAGEFEVESAADLERLLLGIARKKFAMLARREFAARRDRRRQLPLNDQVDYPDVNAVDPGENALRLDLLGMIKERLRGDEGLLFELRQQGKTWDEIARQLHGSPVVLRKQLSRGVHRLALELGLEEAGESELPE